MLNGTKEEVQKLREKMELRRTKTKSKVGVIYELVELLVDI